MRYRVYDISNYSYMYLPMGKDNSSIYKNSKLTGFLT